MRVAQLILLHSISECNNIFDLYFHGHGHGLGCGYGRARDHGCGHGHKVNFKDFIIRSGTIMLKRENKKVKIMERKMKIEVIIKGHLSCICCILKHLKQ